MAKTPKPSLRKVLWNTWGAELMVAGLWKLLWSFCVIMGAFFFVRSLQFHVNQQDVSEPSSPRDSSSSSFILN